MEFLRNKRKASQAQYGSCLRFFSRNFRPGGRVFGRCFFSEMKEKKRWRKGKREMSLCLSTWEGVGQKNLK